MSHPAAAAEDNWMEALSAFLQEAPGVEAIQLNPDARTVKMATLGQVDGALLQAKLSEVLRSIDTQWVRHIPEAPPPLAAHTEEGVLQIEKPSCPTAPKFWQWREFGWPGPDELEEERGEEWRTLAAQALTCGITLVLGHLSYSRPFTLDGEIMARFFFAISIIAGGWDAARDAWANMRKGRLDVHFLMLAVAGGAAAIGAWGEGALLLLLFSASGALEHFVQHRTHREIDALTKTAPKQAHLLLPGGATVDKDVQSLRVGDAIVVRPDELFPVDGTVVSGQTAADESTLTGEAQPITKEPGAAVFGGTLNLWGLVELRVDKPATQSALSKIITLIHTAQHLRAPSQRFTDRFGTPYTLLTLGVVAVMFFVWWLVLGIPPFVNTGASRSAFYRAMTLLVVMSPCALVLSIPSAILAAIAWGARRGVLFRGGAAIEKLAEVDVVAMDKTGTLTEGNLQVSLIESFPPGREQEVLRIAVSLEANSNHPIARAITRHAQAQGITAEKLAEFQSIAGQGLRGRTAAGLSYVGRRELVKESSLGSVLAAVPDAPLGFSEVWVLHEQIVGRILLKDAVRAGSRAVLERLAADGVRTIMLTGDRRAAATEVARQLGLAEVRAGLHPEDKVAVIRELSLQGRKVAMVGDGVNDAPSLAAAYVSVAMGARGSDAALEQSDVVLMQDKIEKLLSARRISQRARGVIRQNLVISLGSVILMAVASLFGIVPLALGVLTHEGSTVLVCLNSLRLLFEKE